MRWLLVSAAMGFVALAVVVAALVAPPARSEAAAATPSVAITAASAVPLTVTNPWISRYNGPGNSTDTGYAVVFDDDGDAVLVTGASMGPTTGYDYATIKYDSSGQVVWASRYNGPGNSTDMGYAVVFDDDGDAVLVTGASMGPTTDYDYATIKYDSSGQVVWASRYNGPGVWTDTARSIGVDGSGNVYVTGSSWDTGSGYDYATIKYNSSGAEQWVSRYNGPGNGDDWANGIAVDANGNSYVTGKSIGSGSGYDYATIKYDSSGQLMWAGRYNGPGNSNDEATGIAVDTNGNTYVTGDSTGSGTFYDYATVKYNSSGAEQWVSRYNGPGNGPDWAKGIAVDANGNSYVTGDSVGSGTFFDYATIKYDTTGNQQWVSRYNGPGNSSDWANGIAVDANGNAYVTGGSWSNDTLTDYATIKYDASGNQKWVSRYNGPANSSDEATGVAVDGNGNAYVTGGSAGDGTCFDYATLMYHTALPGSLQGIVNPQGRANKSGAVVTAGTQTTTSAPSGYFVIDSAAPGAYTISTYLPGYLPAQRGGVVVSDGVTTTLSPVTLFGGDTNNDGHINVTDLTHLGANFGTAATNPDINGDGAVNVYDLAMIGSNLGRSAPTTWP